jgi:hypothetical protein
VVVGGFGLLVTACATSFYGDAMFPGGARHCWDKCRGLNLEMASFVYVGEYSTACVCKPQGTAARALNGEHDQAAVVAAAAGVELQRRRLEQQGSAASAGAAK